MAEMNWTTEKRKLSELIEWERNPRQLSKHDAEHIQKSLEKFGVADPLVINLDNTIIGGHQRKRILKMINDPNYEVDVRVPERLLTDDEVAELNVRLNKNSGNWDFDILANEFEMDDLLEWGFSEKELMGLDFGDEPEDDPGAQIDKAEELREKWGVELGQLWKLGEHRLICGDCTDKAVVDRLMGGEKADAVVTDPPYALFGNSTGVAGIVDDKMVRPFFRDIAKTSIEFTKMFSHVYVCCDWHSAFVIQDVMQTTGLTAKNLCIWDKGDGGIGANYQNCYEMIWFFSNSPKRIGTLGKKLTGEKTVNGVPNIWRFSRATKDRVYNAEKPVELFSVPIKHATEVYEIVLDLFLGGGTTIIACENLNRKCRAAEISPAYCAVSIERWHEMTGEEPELLDSIGAV